MTFSIPASAAMGRISRIRLALFSLLFGSIVAALSMVRAGAPPEISSGLTNGIVIAEDSVSNVLSFVVTDDDTDLTISTNLILTIASTDDTLVTTNGLSFGGTGTNRTLFVTPVTNAFGTNSITVQASDPDGDLNFVTFSLIITNVNDPPSFSIATNALVSAEDAKVIISNFVSNASAGPGETGTLTFSVSSTNLNLFSTNGVSLSGSGTNRTLTYTPLTNAFGTNLVTIILADDGNLTATNTLTIVVTNINDAPMVSVLASNLTMGEDLLGTNYFTVVDVDPETTFTSLNVTGNNSLIATSVATNLLGGGTNGLVIVAGATSTNDAGVITATNYVVVHTLTNAFGSAVVSITANDGSGSLVTNTFNLTVTNINDAPSFSLTTNSLVSGEDTKVSLTNFLFNVSPGANETEAVTISVSSTNLNLFATNGITVSSGTTNRTLTYAPLTNAFGTNLVTIIATDVGGLTATNTLTIVITNINDAPMVSVLASNLTMGEDLLGTNYFTVVDVDPETTFTSLNVTGANSLIATSVATNLLGGGTNGLVIVAGATSTNDSGVITATNYVVVHTLTNAFGSAVVSITANDGSGSLVTNTFNLTVTNINDAPSFSLTTNSLVSGEDTKVSLTNFLFNVSPGANETEAVTISVSSTNLNLFATNGITVSSGTTNRTLTYAPLTNAFGTNLVTIIATDVGGLTATNTLTIVITNINDAPVVSVLASNVVMGEDLLGTNYFTVVDVDPGTTFTSLNVTGANSLIATSESTNLLGGGTNGLVIVAGGTATNGAGVITATNYVVVHPLTNAFGTTTVFITATDGSGSLVTNKFNLAVTNINDAPSFSLTTNSLVSGEDTKVSLTNFLFNVSPGANETEAVTISVSSTNLNLFATNGITVSSGTTNRTLTYAPLTNAFGTNLVTIIATDVGGLTATNTLTIVITNINDAPVVSVLASNVVMGEDLLGTNYFTVVDVDPGTTFTSLNVTGANSLIATSASTNLLGGGTNGLVIVAGGTTTNGTGVILATNYVVVHALTNAFGTTTVFITATDGSGSLVTNKFNLAVTNINDAPSFSLTTNSLVSGEDTKVSLTNFLFNVSPGANETEAVTISVSSTNLNLFATNGITVSSGTTNRTLTYAPLTNAFGTNLVTIIATDVGGLTATNTLTIVITNINDTPVVSVLASNVVMGEDLLGTNYFTVVDVDPGTTFTSLNVTGANSLIATSASTNLLGGGTNGLVIVAGGTTTNGAGVILATNYVVVHALTNAFGTTTVFITATDGSGSLVTNKFNLAVTNINDAPSFSLTTNSLVSGEDTKVSLTNFLFNVSPGANETEAVTISVSSTNLNLFATNGITVSSGTTNRTLIYAPLTNAFGTNLVTIIATDVGGLTATNTLTIVITNINDAPVVSVLASNVVMGEDLLGTNYFTVVDVDPGTTFTSLNVTGANSLIATSASTNLLGGGTNGLVIVAGGTTTNGAGVILATNYVVIKPLTNAFGTTTVFITATDGSGSLVTNKFNLAVTNINDAPSFSLTTNSLVSGEDTKVSLTNFLFNVSPGANETEAVTISVSSTNLNLFATNGITVSSGTTNRTLIYAPLTNAFGTNLVTIIATDVGGLTATNTLTIVITNINDAPVVSVLASNVVMGEDLLGTNYFTVVDVDPGTTFTSLNVTGANSLIATSASTNLLGGGTNGLVIVAGGTTTNGAGVILATNYVVIKPLTNAFGTTTVFITATDGSGSLVTNKFNLAVTNINDAPSFSLTTNSLVSGEDTKVSLTNFLFNVSPGANETEAVTISVSSTNLNLFATNGITVSSGTTNRTLIYAPLTNAFGTNLVTIIATDVGGLTATNTLTIVITNINDAPVVSVLASNVVMGEDLLGTNYFTVVDVDPGTTFTSLNVTGANSLIATSESTNLLGGGTNGLVIVAGGTATNGAGVILATNYVVIKPLTNAFGTTTVFITATDGSGSLVTNKFNLAVTNINDAPSFSLTTNSLVSGEDTKVSLTNFLFNVSPGANETEAVTISVSSTNLNLFATNGITVSSGTTNRTLIYAPLTNAFGTNLVTIIATDVGGLTATNTLTIVITNINDAPVVSVLASNVVMGEDLLGTNYFTVVDVDPGTTFTSLNVTGANSLIATSASTNLLGGGTNGLVIVAGGTTTNGAGVILATNYVVIKPLTNAFGTTTVFITATDGSGSLVTNKFNLAVTNINDAPSFSLTTNSLVSGEDTKVSLTNFLFNVSPGANETEAVTISVSSTNLNLFATNGITVSSGTTNRTLIYAPLTNAFGTNLVTIIATDVGGLTATNTLTIVITNINDAPVVSVLASNVVMGEDLLGTNYFTVVDVDPGTTFTSLNVTGANSLIATSESTNLLGGGTNGLVIVAGGTATNVAGVILATNYVVIKPLTNAFGTTTVFITATDGSGSLVTNKFNLAVTNINDAPSFSLTTNSLVSGEDTKVSLTNFLFNVSPGANETEAVTISVSSTNLNLFATNGITVSSGTTNRTLTYAPLTNAFGTSLVTIIATDVGGLTATNTLTIVITNINDAPVVSVLASNVVMGEDLLGTNYFTVVDVDPGTTFTSLNVTGANSLIATSASTNLLGGGTNGLVIVAGGTTTNVAGVILATNYVVVHPLTNAFGTTTVFITATDGSGSLVTNKFNLAVTNINDAPSFSLTTNSLVSGEDTKVSLTNFLFNVSPGPNESETVTFSLTSTNLNLFATNGVTLSSGTTNRNLAYVPLTNAIGTNLVTIIATDAGGLTATNTLTIVITNINDAPVLAMGLTNLGMLEETTATNFFAITDADTGTTFTNLNVTGNGSVIATSTNTFLLGGGTNGLVVGMTSSNWYVAVTPKTNAFGTAAVFVTVTDSAGALVTNRFNLSVTNVNDAPTFAIANTNITVRAGRAVIVTNFVLNLSAGPNEPLNTVTNILVVSNSAPSMFSVQPVITGSGTNRNLTFTTKSNLQGSSSISLRAFDNAGIDFGGTNASTNVTFTITVTNSVALSTFSVVVSAGELKLEGAVVQPDGSVNLQISNPAGLDYSVEFSTDLSAWQALSGSETTGQQSIFTDRDAQNVPQRFYRLVGKEPQASPATEGSSSGAAK